MSGVWLVLANGLWILGLAMILAALSWASWVAHEQQHTFIRVLSQAGSQRALCGGLALFCAGLAATRHGLWVRVMWGLLAVMWLGLGVWAGRVRADGNKEAVERAK